jgi:uncharacterized damage-inducible protein DinB
MHAREFLIDTVAHIRPLHAVDGLTVADAERRLANAPHSIADLVAHMAFWQDWWCSRCEGQGAPVIDSAATGWPAVAAGSWADVHGRFRDGLERMAAFGSDADRPVRPAIEFPPLAHYTVGDAIVHVAQHNSHHLGQVILLRQLMGTWPPPSGSWTW